MANKLTAPRKKLTPASLTAQRAWAGFPAKLKKELRKNLPDTDKDKVPDGFDCRPRNRKRQESFLSQDLDYVNSHSSVQPDKLLGVGCYGAVFSVKGNNRMVVKVPNGFENTRDPNLVDLPSDTISKRQRRATQCEVLINREGNDYEFFGFEHKPLFIPTKKVNIGNNGLFDRDFTGLLRPKLYMITDNVPVSRKYANRITVSQLEDMRQKIIQLSHEGYMFGDGLQVGIDSAGRLLIYDLGGIIKVPVNQAVDTNHICWYDFLKKIGKYEAFRRDGIVPGIKEYDEQFLSKLRSAYYRKMQNN